MEKQSEMNLICPICKLEKGVVSNGTDFGRNLFYKCERCGQYAITSTAKRMAESRSLLSLSSWIREKSDFGLEPPDDFGGAVQTNDAFKITVQMPFELPENK